MTNEAYKHLFESAISALAAIDRELGLPDDGCNATALTIAEIQRLKKLAAISNAAAKAETADVGEPVAFAHFAENGNIRLWAPERPRDLDGNIAQALYTADQLAAAVAAERERAATVCERIADDYNRREGLKYPELKTDAETGANECADAIRAGAKEPSDA